MAKDKCSNCGTTKSETFWTFEDHTMLCDKCHKHYGKDWQKEIDEKHGKKKGSILKNIFVGIGAFFMVLGILSYFGFLNSSENTISDSSNTPTTQVLPRAYCGDRECTNGETCDTCSQDCGQCVQQKVEENTIQSSEYEEPYYSTYCDKITPYDLTIREAAANAIRKDPGGYNIVQLFDIYDWVKNNIIYQNVPLAGIPYPAKETLLTKSGDCKNQAVLIASMIEAIGGTAKVVIDSSCQHAYSIVRFGPAGENLDQFINAVSNHYNSDVNVSYFTNRDGVWVIFDPAGGNYPGNTLSQCSGNRKLYYIDTCLSCINQFPDKPYTYETYCYADCPSGTIHNNNYSCSPCPSGYWSFNNACVTCQSGYVLHTDGKCYLS